MILEKIQHQ